MTSKLVSVVIVSKDRKKDLVECLNSYENQSYKPVEIIVVDNASRPPLLIWLPKKFKNVKLVTSDTNLGAAEGRNKGLAESHSDYILFTDDDAYADKDMVKYLVEVFEENKKAGIVQPLVYDKKKKNVFQGAGHDIDLLTGRIKAWGVQEEDKGQYDGVREVPMCGCVWMVEREVFKKIGKYDEDYFIPYEDSDFSIRARKAGYKLYCTSYAKTWHRGQKSTFVHPWVEWLGITSPERAFRVIRNKIIFISKHAFGFQKLAFFGIFLPIYIVVHSLIILFTGRPDILKRYWQGIISGLSYASNWGKLYIPVRRKILYWIMSWQEPVVLLLDKSVRTVLDVGCGEGLPMQIIKSRRRLDYVVGVDLFDPYIEQGREKQIHDEYVKADIRNLPFSDKSFDAVIALQVLEHLPKPEAWKVLKKLERIAKKQVIVATPIGEMHHPAVDNNPLQLHKSAFHPEEFEKRGYKVTKFGRKSLLGENGIVHKTRNDILRKFIYSLNFVMSPLFYAIPSLNDYHFYAVKRLSNKHG